MKRIILIIGALLLGFALKAQVATHTCRYWFDQNHAQAVTTTFGANGWEAELDVGDLTDGLHALHLHVLSADTISLLNIAGDSLYHAGDTTILKWSVPQSHLFLKVNATPAANLEYRYWFDQDYAAVQSGNVGDGFLLLDVANLEEGLHALHVMLKGTEYTASQNYLFLKMDAWEQGTPNYVYHCWFDEDFTNQQSDALGDGHLLLDVNSLEEGMHGVHVMIEGSTLTATQNYLFMKVPPFAADTMDMSHLAYHCWFDQDFEHHVSDSLGNGNLLLDVNDLEDGLHTVHVMLEGSTLTATQSYMFMKMASFANDSVDMSHLAYYCWFDQDFEHRVTDSLGNGNLLLDVSDLEDGLHTVHVMLEGSTLTTTQTYMFLKMAVQDPSTELQYICWFDQDYSNVQTGLVGSGLVELEVNDLSNGIHTVNVQLDNGSLTSPQTYLFYKQPLGGYGVARWEYWINDDYEDRSTTILHTSVDTLEIISLLPVGHPALRSSCFHFHPNGEEPYINAKNQISFRIWDAEMRFMDITKFYVDEQVEQDIVATVFERNTTETFAAPRDNQITWYKLDAVVGDSLAFVADKACTMQLFAPSGEEVLNVSGPESITLRGLHAWEDGTYYLAVHDQTGSGETVSVTYNWVYRYAILAYDVHQVGNGGCSTITFNGNGYNSLLDVYLVNSQNDTIRRIDIGHESNSTTTVIFNFYEVNLGVYDAVFHFYDEDIRINGALEVQEPVDIVLTSTVSYPTTFRRDTECTYTYTITNNGNMSAYAVPIFVYISSRTENGISHLKFDGLDLVSVISDLNMDSLSNNDVALLKEWSEEIGDDHHFYRFRTIDEDTGDSILVRSNFFYANIAPFETKSLFLKITANESINVWMTVPNDTVQPITLIPNRGSGQYCCHAEQVQCVLDIACGVIDLANLVASMAGTNPADWATDAANCICSGISLIHSKASKVFCAEEGPGDFFDGLRSLLDKNSILGWAMSCIQSFIPGGRIADVVSAVGNGSSIVSLFAHPLTAMDCITSFFGKKPNCPPGDPKGGQSTPVQPCEPNEIRGYLAESGSHYMMQEIQTITYEIESENDTTATAAAHTIIVRDTLDVNKFDVASLAAYRVTIHDKVLELNGEHNFVYTLDLRPNVYVIAQIQLECDDETGIVVWTITSLDPMTMEPTTDPNQGALPINYNGEGIATFTFNIDLKEPFLDGTEISNRVGIIFDLEEPVITDTWTNTVDAVKPVSHIESVTPVDDSLNFNFVSSDNRSGIWYHTLYYRNDSTEQQWQVRKAQIFENSYMLHLEDLQTTEYLVMAVDSAGNHEDKLFNAEYVFSLDSLVYYTLTLESQGCGEVNGAGTYLAGSHVAIEAVPDEGCQFEQWNDGNTDNPRTIELVQDTTFVAQFTFGQTDITQTTAFTEGWNWWSTYIEMSGIDGLSLLEEGLGTNGLVIKSQSDGYTEYYEDYNLWYGSLESINNESSYMVKTSTSCTVNLAGNTALPSQHPITVDANGWTWIGYPVTYDMDINVALGGLASIEGDMLKAQEGYAEFYDGYGWYGPLETLIPGMGYMYKSTSASPATFTYPSGSKGDAADANLSAKDNHWVPAVSAYPYNMTVTAVVELDGEELRSDRYELAVFANGESRGSVRLMYVEPVDRYVAFLTIAGEEAANLSFALYDTETGMECLSANEAIAFEANATVGKLAEPFVVSFRGTTGMDELANSLRVYPNPVNAGEHFRIGLNAEAKASVHVEIVNALGVETLRATSVQMPATLTAPATAGVYTLRVTVEGKGTTVRKLVVK